MKEQEGIESLAPGGASDILANRQVDKQRLDFGPARVGRLADFVEPDAAHDPLNLRLAGALLVAPEGDGVTDSLEELFVTCVYHDVLQYGLTYPVIWSMVIMQFRFFLRSLSIELLCESPL